MRDLEEMWEYLNVEILLGIKLQGIGLGLNGVQPKFPYLKAHDGRAYKNKLAGSMRTGKQIR